LWVENGLVPVKTKVIFDLLAHAKEGVRIIANKHNAARSGVEQPADNGDVFMLLKQQHRITTLKGTHATCHLKERVKKAI
jgi:hypothetical protein